MLGAFSLSFCSDLLSLLRCCCWYCCCGYSCRICCSGGSLFIAPPRFPRSFISNVRLFTELAVFLTASCWLSCWSGIGEFCSYRSTCVGGWRNLPRCGLLWVIWSCCLLRFIGWRCWLLAACMCGMPKVDFCWMIGFHLGIGMLCTIGIWGKADRIRIAP